MSTELQAIKDAVQHYFDGLYLGDTARLAKVFNPNASLFIEADGELLCLPVPAWFERVQNRATPVSLGLSRDDRILMVDVIGDVNALVKVQCQVEPKVYVDHLSMIKANGRWQIVAKSYCQVGELQN